MARKLASIQIISDIQPISGADKIEVASILGWKVVVKKGEFNIGDACVYVEIDSILPEKPEFEFMRERGFRVKTIKLRKQISQGICFPISILGLRKKLDIDEDVTDVIGIKKYEPPDTSGGTLNKIRGFACANFPGFIPKTDEIRLQSKPRLLEEIKGKKVYISLKLDGTSTTCYYHNNKFAVCSRNFEVRDPESVTFWQKIKFFFLSLWNGKPKFYKPISKDTYWSVIKKYDIPKKLKEYCCKHNCSLSLQGECVGPGIQGNKLNLPEHKFKIFNVWHINEQRYFNFNETQNLINELELESVPILYSDIEFTWNTIDELLKLAEVEYYSEQPGEGVVIRPMQECKSEVLRGDRLSFKVINNSFLLKFGE